MGPAFVAGVGIHHHPAMYMNVSRTAFPTERAREAVEPDATVFIIALRRVEGIVASVFAHLPFDVVDCPGVIEQEDLATAVRIDGRRSEDGAYPYALCVAYNLDEVAGHGQFMKQFGTHPHRTGIILSGTPVPAPNRKGSRKAGSFRASAFNSLGVQTVEHVHRIDGSPSGSEAVHPARGYACVGEDISLIFQGDFPSHKEQIPIVAEKFLYLAEVFVVTSVVAHVFAIKICAVVVSEEQDRVVRIGLPVLNNLLEVVEGVAVGNVLKVVIRVKIVSKKQDSVEDSVLYGLFPIRASVHVRYDEYVVHLTVISEKTQGTSGEMPIVPSTHKK